MEEKEIRNIIVKHTSIMLDNPDKYGIYPTGEFYNNLEKEIITFIKQQLQAKQDVIDKVREYAYDRIAVCNILYSNQNSLERIVADYDRLLNILDGNTL